jgi:hypothetical protein
MRLSPRRGVHRWAGALLLVSSFVSFGCGGPATGTVTGKVYLKDKPLKGGHVTFLTADKAVSRMAKIGEDGSYTIATVPVGLVKISVETKSLRQAAASPRNAPPPGQKAPNSTGPDPKEMLDRYVAIPEKYADPLTSGLEYTVRGGNQPFDIKLP